MARNRSPNRDKAKEMYLESNGSMKLVDIAAKLNLKDSQIRKWKSEDKWDEELKGALPKTKRSVTKKIGAPKGNKNAIGNSGGAPKKNKNAETHGFFSKYLPEETLSIIQEIQEKNPLDILWENINIQYAAIIRAQRIMFVKDKDDKTKELKKIKIQNDVVKISSDAKQVIEVYREEEYEVQQAWDKHANFLNAQSRAMATLQGMIRQYDDLLKIGLATEEQKLRIEKLKLEIEAIKDPLGDNEQVEDDGFIEALKGEVTEVWADEIID